MNLKRMTRVFLTICPVAALSLTTAILPATSTDALRSATVVVQPSRSPATLMAQAENLSQLEKDVLDEMNLARTDPAAYVAKLQTWRSKFDGKLVDRGEGVPKLTTQEGVAAVDEAINFLSKNPPVTALKLSNGMSLAAADHVRDQGPKGSVSHTGNDGSEFWTRLDRYGKRSGESAENIGFGYSIGSEVVMQLIIDDGVPDRGHRTNLFNPKLQMTGVSCGPHKEYKIMCVITYASAFEEAKAK